MVQISAIDTGDLTWLCDASVRSASGTTKATFDRAEAAPLSNEYGSCKTVQAAFWPWLRPDSGLGFQAKVLKILLGVSLLDSSLDWSVMAGLVERRIRGKRVKSPLSGP